MSSHPEHGQQCNICTYGCVCRPQAHGTHCACKPGSPTRDLHPVCTRTPSEPAWSDALPLMTRLLQCGLARLREEHPSAQCGWADCSAPRCVASADAGLWEGEDIHVHLKTFHKNRHQTISTCRQDSLWSLQLRRFLQNRLFYSRST